MKSDRKKQVATLKKTHGKDFFKTIGRKGGLKNDKTRFTPETGKVNAQKRWAIYREKQKEV